MDLLSNCSAILGPAGFATRLDESSGRSVLLFENDTVLGFLLAYPTTAELIANWQQDSTAAINKNQFALRLASQKAWNTYVVLLAERLDSPTHLTALTAIEEDLSGTRKIARAGVSDNSAVSEAVLTLLPLQTAPQLGAVDIQDEIRQRTTELPERAVQMFLQRADGGFILQAFEESP